MGFAEQSYDWICGNHYLGFLGDSERFGITIPVHEIPPEDREDDLGSIDFWHFGPTNGRPFSVLLSCGMGTRSLPSSPALISERVELAMILPDVGSPSTLGGSMPWQMNHLIRVARLLVLDSENSREACIVTDHAEANCLSGFGLRSTAITPLDSMPVGFRSFTHGLNTIHVLATIPVHPDEAEWCQVVGARSLLHTLGSKGRCDAAVFGRKPTVVKYGPDFCIPEED